MKNSRIVACFVLVCGCNCTQLPSSFKKCDRKSADFNRCLTAAAAGAIKQLNRPIKEVGLANLEPLEIPSLEIGAGTSAVGFKQNYKNMKVSGFTKSSCSDVQMDLESNTLKMECFVPEVKMEFEYNINGKILLLPVYGTGPGSIILDGVKYTLSFTLEEYEKKGKKHFKVVDNKFVMDPELIRFNLENLFDGDKTLGDNINTVINENWQEIFADVRSSYQEALGQIFGSIFNNFLTKVSISEMFSDK